MIYFDPQDKTICWWPLLLLGTPANTIVFELGVNNLIMRWLIVLPAEAFRLPIVL